MLGLFRNHYAINHFFLLVYIFIIRHTIFLKPYSGISENSSWLHSSFLHFLYLPIVENVMACFLLWIHAILINNFVNSFKLSRETSLFPGLFYILIMSLTAPGLDLHPVLFANTFLILGFSNIMESTRHVDIRHRLFNAGFFISISVLILPSYIFLVLAGFFSFYSLKAFKMKGIVQYLIGVFSACVVVFGFQYLIQNEWSFALQFHLFGIKFLQVAPAPFIWVFIGILSFSLLYNLIQYPEMISKKNIQSRKKIESLFLLILFCSICILLFFKDDPKNFTMLAFPVGSLMGLRLAEYKNRIWEELYHLVFLAAIMFNQYFSLSL